MFFGWHFLNVAACSLNSASNDPGFATLAEGVAGNVNKEPSDFAGGRGWPSRSPPTALTTQSNSFASHCFNGFYFLGYAIFVVPMAPLKANGAWSK